MVKSFLKNFRLSRSLSNPREEIQDLIREDGPSEETLDAHEKILLNNILGLRAISAADVMVPRADIIAVDLDEETEVIIKKMTTAGHSRLPVYQGVLDKVLGVLHIKDVTSKIIEGGEINIKELLAAMAAIFTWSNLLKNKNVVLFSDNLDIVQIWTSGSTTNSQMMKLIRIF